MKKSKALIRLAAAFMAAIMALSLCACGDSRDNAASSGESSEEIQLTAEQQVEKLLLEEFEKNYGDNLETCEFRNIKIFTAEEIAEDDELFSNYNFVETDIVFSASYDLKAPDGKDVAPLLPANERVYFSAKRSATTLHIILKAVLIKWQKSIPRF